MHVMRLHIADLKLWSANDRRTGGKAVPIKEHCPDTYTTKFHKPLGWKLIPRFALFIKALWKSEDS